jgi:hypothetical protein
MRIKVPANMDASAALRVGYASIQQKKIVEPRPDVGSIALNFLAPPAAVVAVCEKRVNILL